MNLASAALLAFALFWSPVVGAEVPIPSLTGRVIDQTATLTTEQVAALEQTLRTFESRKGSQVAILIVPTSEPETIEQYALRVAERWKPGRKNVDDGVLLVVAKNDRTMRIEVGYGLEGALNDATSKRIISEIIAPRFRQGDFHGGIASGVDRILRVIDGEPLPEPKAGLPGNSRSLGHLFPVFLLLALVVGGVLRTVLGRIPGALVTGGAVSVIAWFLVGAVSVAVIAGLIALFFTLLGGGMGGRGVGGHHGGFGGGGFSGGGGGFGGGGASGRW